MFVNLIFTDTHFVPFDKEIISKMIYLLIVNIRIFYLYAVVDI